MKKINPSNNSVNHSTSVEASLPPSDIPSMAIGADSVSEAQTRLSSAPIVANCIDTLKVSLWVEYEYDFDLIKRLDNAKKKAQEEDVDSYPVEIGGISWNCMRIGSKLYSYRLIRGDIRLLVSSRDSEAPIANTRLEIGSMSCWVPWLFKSF
jgi:hypothetical protein